VPLLALATLGLSGFASWVSAQNRTLPGFDVDVDEGALSSLVVAARAHVPLRQGGEAFYALGAGQGGSVTFAATFEERFVARVRLGVSALREDDVDARATAADVWIEMLWTRAWVGLGFEAGGIVGYERLTRPAYESTQGGLVAGGVIGASRAVRGGWEVFVNADVTWSVLDTPSFALPTRRGSRMRRSGRGSPWGGVSPIAGGDDRLTALPHWTRSGAPARMSAHPTETPCPRTSPRRCCSSAQGRSPGC
jgi:hypothetical protein